jgi:hypothetical protein
LAPSFDHAVGDPVADAIRIPAEYVNLSQKVSPTRVDADWSCLKGITCF